MHKKKETLGETWKRLVTPPPKGWNKGGEIFVGYPSWSHSEIGYTLRKWTLRKSLGNQECGHDIQWTGHQTNVQSTVYFPNGLQIGIHKTPRRFPQNVTQTPIENKCESMGSASLHRLLCPYIPVPRGCPWRL